MKLKNITVLEFCLLDEAERGTYEFAIKYSDITKAKDIFKIGDLTKKTFGEVKDYQTIASSKDAIIKFTELLPESLNMNIFDYISGLNYIFEEVDRVNKIEQKLLSHEPTIEEVSAGIDRFAQLGVGIQIDNLAHGKVWLYETIRNLKYEDCLFKLLLEKLNNDYKKDYYKIITQKNNGTV